jgi:hypothetical protein
MRPRHVALLLSLLLLSTVPVAGQAADQSAEPAGTSTARVTYVTGSTVYVDAGRDDGLAPGDTIEIVRGGEVVLTLKVTEVSNHRATCALPAGSPELVVGDEVRFRPSAAAAAAPVAAAAAAPTQKKSRSAARSAGFRGRVGLRYLGVRNRITGGTEYSQPGLDLRLDGNQITGGPWSLNVDVRTSRISRTGGTEDGTTDDRTRIYRIAASYGGVQSPWRITAGRQFSSDLASVAIFDGIAFSWNKRRWATGGFTGTQPDPLDFSYSSEIREHGAWFKFRNSTPTGKSWFVTTGLVGSYAGSEVNREFLYVQGRYTGRKFFVYGLQEVDFNRDWKKELEGESFSPTSSFVSLRWQALRALSLNAGYDNRRLVRLFRDRETPETEFDDAFRQGAWVGAMVNFARRYRISVDARGNTGGASAQDSQAYSMMFSAGGFTRWNIYAQARGTSFNTDLQEGVLASVSTGATFGRYVSLAINGGARDDNSTIDEELSTTLAWFGVDLDIALARHWYFFLSVERNDGDFEDFDQIFTSVTYRF